MKNFRKKTFFIEGISNVGTRYYFGGPIRTELIHYAKTNERFLVNECKDITLDHLIKINKGINIQSRINAAQERNVFIRMKNS